MLVKRLNDHIDDKKAMSQTQFKAIELLLKKTLPDLASIELKGDANAPVALHVTGSDVNG
jgi:hypothetical protein